MKWLVDMHQLALVLENRFRLSDLTLHCQTKKILWKKTTMTITKTIIVHIIVNMSVPMLKTLLVTPTILLNDASDGEPKVCWNID